MLRLLTLVCALGLCAGAAETPALQPADLPPVTWFTAPTHPPVPVAENGQARAVVYVAVPQPSASLALLVKELTEVIRLSSGADLQVVKEPPPADRAAIIIGDCAESRAAGIDAAALPLEGFEVKTAANRVFLVGSTAPLPENKGITDVYSNDGTAWAVADFLERFVNVRWYWPTAVGGRCLTPAATLTVPPAHYRDQPVFAMRQFFPPYGWKLPQKARWFDKEPLPFPPGALPEGVQGIDMAPYLPLVRGGNSWPYLIKVHQPQNFAANPKQWEAQKAMLQKKADGSPDYNMLCYSAPETLAYLLEGCADSWDRGKGGAVPWVTTTCVTVSPGDYPVDCHCAPCRKTMAEGGPARVLALFVKRMCEEVKRRWPAKKVLFLPYWNYAECPRDMSFPDNLAVQLCADGEPMALRRQAPVRAKLEANIRAWAERAGGRITIWDYSDRGSGWSYAPLQYPHVVQEFYQSHRDVVAGSFLNGGLMADWVTTAPTLYVWMRVMWNPDVNVDAILDEMCRRLFGKAGNSARDLLRLMCDRWEKAEWRAILEDAGKITDSAFADSWPPDVVARMKALRQQALDECKDDPVARQRLAYWGWTFDAFLKDAAGKTPPVGEDAVRESKP